MPSIHSAHKSRSRWVLTPGPCGWKLVDIAAQAVGTGRWDCPRYDGGYEVSARSPGFANIKCQRIRIQCFGPPRRWAVLIRRIPRVSHDGNGRLQISPVEWDDMEIGICRLGPYRDRRPERESEQKMIRSVTEDTS